MLKLNKNIISEIVKDHDEIEQIYITGSAATGLLDNFNDVDILLIVSSQNIPYPKYELFQKLTNCDRVSVFSALIDFNSTSELKIRNQNKFAYCSGPNAKLIYNKSNNPGFLERYDILKNDNFKKECVLFMLYELSTNLPMGYLKKPYRLLLSCYILDNNSYNITSEQKQMVNQVHDEKNISNELLSYCKQVIYNVLKNEFNREEDWLVR